MQIINSFVIVDADFGEKVASLSDFVNKTSEIFKYAVKSSLILD